ncbi:DUF775-domain-containing protein [Laetiporus sulphureus 93-53]|uniref:DUF775-domain-containing protein n=1 Tax=Laetiporus sulphureus 93-53 TaxID=1314785 RepID=A0A165BT81_9APHY|nr:DUF775-domain-containing protein [Laetiporus sulphureus 93-53]KZT01606.1 DUF775-domain-containing protein [Laetiporus sulphureus 93-53]
MFGCCVAGRPLQTNLQQIDDTHAIFELPAPSTINHICVFLLGSVPFPDGYGATVHLHWPGKGFQLLGMLSNDKPSAIFRLRGTFSSQSSRPTLFGDASGTSTPTTAMVTDVDTTPAYLGIAIEPLSTIEAEVATIPSAITRPAITQADTTLLAERIVKHLFNYVSGFAGGGLMTPETPIPLAVIARWYEAFVSKVRMVGIGFLENQQ